MKYEVLGERVLPQMQDLYKRIPHLTSAVLSTVDGFNICAIGIEEDQAGKLAAMSGSLLSMGASMVSELNPAADGDEAEYLTVKAGGYLLFSTRVGVGNQELALTVCAGDSSPLGAVMVGVRYVAHEIVTLVGTESLESDFGAMAQTPDGISAPNAADGAIDVTETAATTTDDGAAAAAATAADAHPAGPGESDDCVEAISSIAAIASAPSVQVTHDADDGVDGLGSRSVASQPTTAGLAAAAVDPQNSARAALDEAGRDSESASFASRSPALGAGTATAPQQSTWRRDAVAMDSARVGADVPADDTTADATPATTADEWPAPATPGASPFHRVGAARAMSPTTTASSHGVSDSTIISRASAGVDAADDTDSVDSGNSGKPQTPVWSTPSRATTDTTAAAETGDAEWTTQQNPLGNDKPQTSTPDVDGAGNSRRTADSGRIDTRSVAASGIRSTLDWWRRRDRERGCDD